MELFEALYVERWHEGKDTSRQRQGHFEANCPSMAMAHL
jgi:hypothetical protein